MPTDHANTDRSPPASADERWVIVVVPEASEVPAGRRVAQLLRTAKRRHGLRCIEVSERTPDEQLQAARAEVIELRRQLEQAKRRQIYDRRAKERQKEAGKVHGRGKVPVNLPEPIKADARDGRLRAGRAGVTTARGRHPAVSAAGEDADEQPEQE